jgi:hypothetical protein
VQLWSEIKLTITNPITDQIALHSVFIYWACLYSCNFNLEGPQGY